MYFPFPVSFPEYEIRLNKKCNGPTLNLTVWRKLLRFVKVFVEISVGKCGFYVRRNWRVTKLRKCCIMVWIMHNVVFSEWNMKCLGIKRTKKYRWCNGKVGERSIEIGILMRKNSSAYKYKREIILHGKIRMMFINTLILIKFKDDSFYFGQRKWE